MVRIGEIMKKTILVTWGAGFIGTNLCRLMFEDFEITVVDLIAPTHKYFTSSHVVDIRLRNQLKAIFETKHFDVVVHLAAQTSSIISQESPLLDYETNIIGTQNVTGLCREFSAPLVFSSSMAIYNVQKMSVDTIPEPSSNYGVSKYLGETFVKDLARADVNFSILRLFNVYGVGQDLSNLKQGMLSIFVAMAVAEGSITVKGSAARTRDFIHVEDVCKVIISEVRNLTIGSIPYQKIQNICSGKSISVETLVGKIVSEFDYPIKVSYEDGFKEDIMTVECTDCNLTTSVEFGVGLKEFVEWSRNELEGEI